MLNRVYFPVFFLVTIVASAQRQQADSSMYYYEKGNLAVHNHDLQAADVYYSRSLIFRQYADTYYNRAVVRRARSNFQGFCADLESAANMGDTLSYNEFWHFCGTTDTVHALNKESGATRSIIKRAAYTAFEDRSDYDVNGKMLLRYFVEANDTTYISGSLIETSFQDTTRPEGKMMKYMHKNIVYPQEAKEQGIQGVVTLSFILTKQGKIRSMYVVKGQPGGLTEAAIEIVGTMPQWSPAKLFGRPISRKINFPVNFELR